MVLERLGIFISLYFCLFCVAYQDSRDLELHVGNGKLGPFCDLFHSRLVDSKPPGCHLWLQADPVHRGPRDKESWSLSRPLISDCPIGNSLCL